MRYIMFTAACLFLGVCHAQTDSLYLVTYERGPAWNAAKPPVEQPFFKEHSALLGTLRKEGRARFGARYADKGIIMLAAPSRKAALEIIAADAAVANITFVADVQRLSVFFEGCIEKPK